MINIKKQLVAWALCRRVLSESVVFWALLKKRNKDKSHQNFFHVKVTSSTTAVVVR
jgi:hypothetical protein